MFITIISTDAMVLIFYFIEDYFFCYSFFICISTLFSVYRWALNSIDYALSFLSSFLDLTYYAIYKFSGKNIFTTKITRNKIKCPPEIMLVVSSGQIYIAKLPLTKKWPKINQLYIVT